jgi:hypothetical protein
VPREFLLHTNQFRFHPGSEVRPYRSPEQIQRTHRTKIKLQNGMRRKTKLRSTRINRQSVNSALRRPDFPSKASIFLYLIRTRERDCLLAKASTDNPWNFLKFHCRPKSKSILSSLWGFSRDSAALRRRQSAPEQAKKRHKQHWAFSSFRFPPLQSRNPAASHSPDANFGVDM